VEPNEPRTEVFDVGDAPIEWETARPRYFGVTPHGLAVVLAAFAFGAGVVLVVSGYTAAGSLLLVAALLLAALWAEQARRRRESSFDRAAAAAVDRTRALAGLTGSSVRAWTSAGRRITRLRLAVNRLARRRAQLQYALGGAAYAGDEAEAARLRAGIAAIDEQIASWIAEAGEAVAEMRRTTARERLAVAPTEVRPPVAADDAAEPGATPPTPV
jgi:hypothetical protein